MPIVESYIFYNAGVVTHDLRIGSRSQSYDFKIYSYNASVVVGYSVFQSRRKYFSFQNELCRS
jgi:hypothetical protein